MTTPTPTNPGNKNTGPESIDRPFKRRRNLGQKSGGEVTRADRIAVALSHANTVRELGDIAIRLGTPEALVRNILNRPVRNSIKVMQLHSAARHHHKAFIKKQREIRARRFPPKRFPKVYRPDPEPGHTGGA